MMNLNHVLSHLINILGREASRGDFKGFFILSQISQLSSIEFGTFPGPLCLFKLMLIFVFCFCMIIIQGRKHDLSGCIKSMF